MARRYAVMLLVLGVVVLLGVAGRIWRKRIRRIYNSIVHRCPSLDYCSRPLVSSWVFGNDAKFHIKKKKCI